MTTISQIVRILFYNAIFVGLGSYVIRNFFHTQYDSVIFVLLLLGIVIFDSIIDKKKLSNYGLKKPTTNDIKFALIIFALFFPVSIASRVLFPDFDAMYAPNLGLNYSNILQFLIFIVPIAVLIEEIGVRSLFQSKIFSIFGSRLAIYATIINFTLLHFSWFFSLNLTNFLIVLGTVFAYSIFIAFLFDRTKNILATFLVHILLNAISSLQILFHINNQVFYELILWSAWGIYFILLAPLAVDFLKSAFNLLKLSKKRTVENLSGKISLVLLSVFSLLVIIFMRYFL